ncbi:MAG: WbuC family cupin fold metalloprotein [Lentisphaerota bacterium]
MKLVDVKLLDSLTSQAKIAPRKRSHYNLHSDLNEATHRLCIAVEQGSYVRPHRHFINTPKWELLTILRGRISVLTFDEHGTVSGRYNLESTGDVKSLELSPETLHTFVSMESGTAVLEVKPGPYIYPDEKDFASWAPKEGEPNAEKLELWYRTAKIGDKFKD